jgi:hypothetical protein
MPSSLTVKHARRLRDHVAGTAGLNLGDGDDRRIEGVDSTRDEGLKCLDNVARDRDRVEAVVRRGGVPASPVDYHLDGVARGQDGPRSRPDDAGRVPSATMQREGRGRRGAARVEAFFEHEARPVIALLPGLKHEDDVPRELVAAPCEQVCGTHEHRHVGIVAAGMHHILHFGSELEARLLLDGEGIHIRAQKDRRAWSGALERRQDRRQPLALPDAKSQAVEGLENRRLRPRQVQPQLRVAVEGAPEAHHVGLKLLGVAEQSRERHGPMLRSAANSRQRLAAPFGQAWAVTHDGGVRAWCQRHAAHRGRRCTPWV